MSIKFNIVQRGGPGHSEAPKKYYPSIQSTGRVSVRQLAERASHMCTLTTADMMAAIEALLSIIPDELANGNIVELGDLGKLSVRGSPGNVQPLLEQRRLVQAVELEPVPVTLVDE